MIRLLLFLVLSGSLMGQVVISLSGSGAAGSGTVTGIYASGSFSGAVSIDTQKPLSIGPVKPISQGSQGTWFMSWVVQGDAWYQVWIYWAYGGNPEGWLALPPNVHYITYLS